MARSSTTQDKAIKAHRLWIREQRKRHPELPANEAIMVDGNLCCMNCGCPGNRDCGHDCLDETNYCTLLGDDTCPCCMIESRPATDDEVDTATGQGRLL